jgi:hypothetical protein
MHKKGMPMKRFATMVSIALFGIAAMSDVMPASANKMNGKCCVSSDGGRSNAYRRAVAMSQVPHTCSAYAASCVRVSTTRTDRVATCTAARAACMRTGVFVGPYSGRQFDGMQRM